MMQIFQEEDGKRRYSSGLRYYVGNEYLMASMPNRWYSMPEPMDIAATQLGSVLLKGASVETVDVSRFAIDSDDANDDLYFVHGFPGKRSYFSILLGNVVYSTSQPYGGWITQATGWQDFDPKLHIAITFPMMEALDEHGQAATIDEFGQARTLPNPNGMSGSLLWKTNRRGVPVGWTPDKATVVGIIHRFNADNHCLIATRIEYVKNLLLSMHEEDSVRRDCDCNASLGLTCS